MRSFSNHLVTFAATALAAAALSACSPQTPAATPIVITMNYTPALRPFGPVFQTCTQMQAGLSLLVNELPVDHIETLPADILLTWGEAGVSSRTAYQTGEEELVFIVHPSNPVTSISSEQLASVLAGKSSTWSVLLQPDCPDCPADAPDRPLSGSQIQLWTYPPGDETLTALTNIPGGAQIPPFQSRQAPDPEAMRQAISLEQTGLGFLPRRWLDDSVKILEVRGLTAGAGRLPILAYPSDPSSSSASSFILCLQQVLNP